MFKFRNEGHVQDGGGGVVVMFKLRGKGHVLDEGVSVVFKLRGESYLQAQR